ncbi:MULTISPECIES: alginate lyase family protein [unclassified Streptomyces]|uniref:alginate lyase family protein n=1 Tax=unclassified Streptomyces TaxID=2593676 RepID=UPI00224F4D73|nr:MULTISPECIES: alginate lyase family protein [unclassified Streptomyces]MCX5062232.1 alginate lyase family protein [Streptomyces sp. NBC_00452]MCX5292159.1 alginate lyase family protein [Streptomyces sp. NBC_00183]
MSRTSPHRASQQHASEPAELSRRGLLRTAGGLTAVLALAGSSAALAGTTAGAAPAAFTHPGMLHNAGDINRAKVRVAAGTDPWLSGWKKLTANSHSQSTWTPNPQATIIRGGTGENYGILYNDIAAAYQNALRWAVGGTAANGDTAVRILNAWSSKLTTLTGNADRFLAAGIYGWTFCQAAELMRGHAGFDLAAFQKMMVNVFYPLNNSFLTHHNGACITNYWANWDLCNMASVMAIGILTDNAAKYDQAVTYFKSGAGNGSIAHAVPFLYTDSGGYGLGQWQESGRDQGHTVMGMGQMGAICEMAWNQGDDLYSYDGRRFMKGAQYVAKYNLGQDVPYTTYKWGTGQNCAQMSQTVISVGSRGALRPVWAMLHYHYNRRLHLDDKYISAMYGRVAPEGGGGDFGSTSGGYDQLGFGTLMYAK